MKPASRTLPAGAALLLALGITAFARQGPKPTFRAATTLVEFTVVASDAQGGPVTDLGQTDFSITENGQTRPIAFFRFEGTSLPASSDPGSPATLPPGIFTNRVEYTPGPPRNVTAIVIDALNTRPEDQSMVRAQVMRYLRALAPATRLAVYRTGERVRIIHDFTDDLASLRARVAAMPPEFNVMPKATDEARRLASAEAEHFNKTFGDDSAQNIEMALDEMDRLEEYFNQQLLDEHNDLTLRALGAIGDHLSGIAGRKNLVWISGGVPIFATMARDRWTVSYETAMRKVAERLASQGVVVYPVQAAGLQGTDVGLSSTARHSSYDQQSSVVKPLTTYNEQRIWASMQLLADVTGGRMFKNSNDLTAGVTAAAADLRGAYSLGFYAASEADARWHQFRVRTTRPGVRLLHRQGYLSQEAAREPRSLSADEWQAVAQNPLGSTAIRLDLRAELHESTLQGVLQIAAADLFFRTAADGAVADLEIAIAEKTATQWTRVRRDGALISLPAADANGRRPELIRFAKDWMLSSETTAVRLIVRDRSTNRHGVLDLPLAKVRAANP
jgi:VWFA-related protein